MAYFKDMKLEFDHIQYLRSKLQRMLALSYGRRMDGSGGRTGERTCGTNLFGFISPLPVWL